MVTTEETKLADLRAMILESFATLHRGSEHVLVTTDMLRTFIQMKYGKELGLSKLGNNLRVLKGYGVLEDEKIRGVRYWRLTGKSFSPAPTVKMLVSFPAEVHEKISALSQLQEMSKTAFIIDMVRTGIEITYPSKKRGRPKGKAPRGKILKSLPESVLAEETSPPEEPVVEATSVAQEEAVPEVVDSSLNEEQGEGQAETGNVDNSDTPGESVPEVTDVPSPEEKSADSVNSPEVHEAQVPGAVDPSPDQV